MKWIDGLKIAAILIIGGLAYEAITANIAMDRADKLIEQLRADNHDIINRLEDAQGRVADLQSGITELERRNSELAKELEASADIARSLREENRRLGEALTASEGAASGITEASKSLGESIDNALAIVDKYPGPAEEK